MLPEQASEYTRQAVLDAITIPVGPRLGNIVVEATGLTKRYGERTLFEGLTFSVPPASIVGAHAAPACARSHMPPTLEGPLHSLQHAWPVFQTCFACCKDRVLLFYLVALSRCLSRWGGTWERPSLLSCRRLSLPACHRLACTSA